MANLPKVVRDTLQAPTSARAKCLATFTLQCEELLYCTLGAWQEEQMSNELKPYHTPPFRMPPFHRNTIKIDIVRLVEIGMLKPISNSRNGLFIIQNPKQANKKAQDYQEQYDYLPTFAS